MMVMIYYDFFWFLFPLKSVLIIIIITNQCTNPSVYYLTLYPLSILEKMPGTKRFR